MNEDLDERDKVFFNDQMEKCLIKYRKQDDKGSERRDCMESVLQKFEKHNEFLTDELIVPQYLDCSYNYDDRFRVSDKSSGIEESLYKTMKRCVTSTTRRASRRLYYETQDPSERRLDEEEKSPFTNMFLSKEDIERFDIRGIDDPLPPEYELIITEPDPEDVEEEDIDWVIDDIVDELEKDKKNIAEKMARDRIDSGQINVRKVLGLAPITLREIFEPDFNVRKEKLDRAIEREVERMKQDIIEKELDDDELRRRARNLFEKDPYEYYPEYRESAVDEFGEKIGGSGSVKLKYKPTGEIVGETTFSIDSGVMKIGFSEISRAFQGKGLFNFIRREVKNLADSFNVDLATSAGAFANQPMTNKQLENIYTSYAGSEVELIGRQIISKKGKDLW